MKIVVVSIICWFPVRVWGGPLFNFKGKIMQYLKQHSVSNEKRIVTESKSVEFLDGEIKQLETDDKIQFILPQDSDYITVKEGIYVDESWLDVTVKINGEDCGKANSEMVINLLTISEKCESITVV